jgi:ABC-type phosphate/phosphonate transport system ATPase subunit
MDVTMIGLQNAGKTSLLRVLSVSLPANTGTRVQVRIDRPVKA